MYNLNIHTWYSKISTDNTGCHKKHQNFSGHPELFCLPVSKKYFPTHILSDNFSFISERATIQCTTSNGHLSPGFIHYNQLYNFISKTKAELGDLI